MTNHPRYLISRVKIHPFTPGNVGSKTIWLYSPDYVDSETLSFVVQVNCFGERIFSFSSQAISKNSVLSQVWTLRTFWPGPFETPPKTWRQEGFNGSKMRLSSSNWEQEFRRNHQAHDAYPDFWAFGRPKFLVKSHKKAESGASDLILDSIQDQSSVAEHRKPLPRCRKKFPTSP